MGSGFADPNALRVLSFVLGSLIGSFLNVVIARLPYGESIVHPRSHCPHCGYMIPSYLNIPILSWLVLRGRCANCGAAISVRYPVVELLTALLFLACFERFGTQWATPASWLFAACLVAITFIDIDEWIIVDEISIPGTAVGLLLGPLALGLPWWSSVGGALCGAGAFWSLRIIFELLRGKEGMGLGDVKLMAMIGAFRGLEGLAPTVMVASFAGSAIGLTLMALGGLRGDEEEEQQTEETGAPEAGPTPPSADVSSAADGLPKDEEEDWKRPAGGVPFGPFLALGALVDLFYRDTVLRLFFGMGDTIAKFILSLLT